MSRTDSKEPNTTCVQCGKRFYSDGTMIDALRGESNPPKGEGAGLCSLVCMAKHILLPKEPPS